jgi:hypothetical protein
VGLERDSAGRVCGNINGRSRLVLVVLLSVTVLFGLFLFAAVSIQPGYASFPGVNGKIVFFSDRDGNYEIYVMNADGSSQTRLTNNGALDWSPDWQRLQAPPPPPPSGPSAVVGGVLESENKLAILLPYLALLGLVGVASTIFAIRRRRKA